MEPFPEAPRLRTIADYQFGRGAGEALFPREASLTVVRSRSDRISQVHADGERLVTFSTGGRFTLGVAGGQRLGAAFESPHNRVVVGEESEPFVRDGKNTFAKFVRDVDPAVRPGDEVLVVNDTGLLAVGRAELPASAMVDFEHGMAVRVRAGIPADH